MSRVLRRITPSSASPGSSLNPISVTNRVFTEWTGEGNLREDGWLEGTYEVTIKNDGLVPVPVNAKDISVIAEDSNGDFPIIEGYSEDLGVISGGSEAVVEIDFDVDIPAAIDYNEPGGGVFSRGCSINREPPGEVVGDISESLEVVVKTFDYSTDSVDVLDPDCSF